MSEHTPGKLVVRGGYSIYTADDKTPVADTCLRNSVPDNDEANARRLVAAWNACDGLSTEQLERAGTLDRASVSRNVAISNTIKNLTAARNSLRAVNAELIAELQRIADANPKTWDQEVRDQFMPWAQNRARAAIASATDQAGTA